MIRILTLFALAVVASSQDEDDLPEETQRQVEMSADMVVSDMFHDASNDEFAEIGNEIQTKFVEAGSRPIDCGYDRVVRDVLGALVLNYEDPVQSGAFLDVGAGVGHYAAQVLGHFGRVDFRKYQKKYVLVGKGITDSNELNYTMRGERCPPVKGDNVAIYCFEPAKAAYERLKERAAQASWALEGFNLVKAVVAAKGGKVDFYSDPEKIDHAASLSPGTGRTKAQEKAVSLDTFISKVVKSRVFLLRLDINGHEYQAIQGLEKTLKDHRIRFIMMEYSPVWKEVGSDFYKTTDLLGKQGYVCFALTHQTQPKKAPDVLLVTGPFAPQDLSKGPQKFQLFCGYYEDFGFRSVLQQINPDTGNWWRFRF